MTPPPQRRAGLRRWAWMIILVGAVAALVIVWRKQASVALPEVDRKDLDPAVARAIAEAERRVRRSPRFGGEWGGLGEVLLAHDLEVPALACFRRAAELSPDDARWHYFVGVLLGRTDLDAAMRELERSAELCAGNDPDNTAPRLRLAEILLEHDRFDAAEAHYRGVQATQPDNPRVTFGLSLLAGRQGRSDECSQQLEKCLPSPFARKKAAAELAREYRRRGEVAKAEEYQRRADAFPRDRDWPDPFTSEFRARAVGRKALLSRAEMFEGMGQLNDAVILLQQVAEEYHDYHAWVGLGCNLGKMNRLREAEEAFRQALRLAPERMQAHYWLSAALVLRAEAAPSDTGNPERYREAAEAARVALAIKRDHALAHYYLGKALLHLDRRAEALAEFRQSIACLPGIPEPYLALAEALSEQGEIEQARHTLGEAQRVSSEKDRRAAMALARLESKPPPQP